ncbi:MAG TPA: hypothetical protein PKO18_04005 [Chitinophagales bacterium]|nr:hypothetical protein [Chitinophagales bacterium]HNL84379.1 hypothetical protein [Chitinophagales bacterium]
MYRIFLFLILLLVLQANAKETKFKFGSVSKEELEMKNYSSDTSVGAVVLFDVGSISYEVSERMSGHYVSYSFKQVFNRKLRIKIFDKKNLDMANQKMVLYLGAQSDNFITKKKAHTINFENNKQAEIEVNKDELFLDRIFDNYYMLKIPFKNVKEGSIIEMDITIESPLNYKLPTWYFQREIPTLFSQFSVSIPEFYKFRKNISGYLAINPPVSEIEDITLNSQENVQSNKTTWTAEKVPAFIREPYLDCADNYLSKIEYELSSVQFPLQLEQPLSMNWKEVNKMLNDAEYLGKQITTSSGFMKDMYDELKSKDNLSKLELMKAAYYAVKKKMRFNQVYSLASLDGTKEAYRKGEGNSADINLILLKLLRDLNFNVAAIAVSTKTNGNVSYFPSLFAFNQLIVQVTLEGKKYLLDATEKAYPMHLLPEEDLNDRGLIISDQNIEWVDLRTNIPSGITLHAIDAKITNEGTISGKITIQRKEYAAANFKEKHNDKVDIDQYTKKLEEDNLIELQDKNIQNLDSVEKPIIETYTFVKQNQTELGAANMLYVNPFIIDKLSVNPFKLNERDYPVNFNHPFDETYIINLSLPEGYAVSELPANASFSLPDNSGKLTYKITASAGNTIQLNCKFSITKSLFSFDEYPNLKEFYNQYLGKLNEMIVIKKI